MIRHVLALMHPTLVLKFQVRISEEMAAEIYPFQIIYRKYNQKKISRTQQRIVAGYTRLQQRKNL